MIHNLRFGESNSFNVFVQLTLRFETVKTLQHSKPRRAKTTLLFRFFWNHGSSIKRVWCNNVTMANPFYLNNKFNRPICQTGFPIFRLTWYNEINGSIYFQQTFMVQQQIFKSWQSMQQDLKAKLLYPLIFSSIFLLAFEFHWT